MSSGGELPEPLPELLAGLPDDVLERLRPKLAPVQLRQRDVLYQPNETQEYAYFLSGSVVSLLSFAAEGKGVEAGVVGREGVVGLPILFGTETAPNLGACQVSGPALRMRARDFAEEALRPGPLRDGLLRYAHAFMTQVAQSAACNRLHGLDQRCARWLLMLHDRVDGDSFSLTHEFMSQMLGVRRAGVTDAMLTARERGAIEYTRGTITVVNRRELEAAACRCYTVTKKEFDRVAQANRLRPGR